MASEIEKGSKLPVMRPCCLGKEVVILTPSKLNLFLEVLGKREDGFHEIDTIVEAVDLCDELSFRIEGKHIAIKHIKIEVEGYWIPTGPGNLIFRAAHLFFAQTGNYPPCLLYTSPSPRD